MRKVLTSIVLAGSLFLAACAGNPAPTLRLVPQVVTKIVNVPVATSCIPSNLSVAPSYPDTDTALKNASGADVRYQLLAAGHPLREARLNQLEGVVQACK